MKKSSLRSQLIIGFLLVTVPLIVLLILNNWYAIEVVQKQVAGSNKNLVTMNMKQMDQKLAEVEKYLLKTSLQNADLQSFGSYPSGSEEAVYGKVNTFNLLTQDITYYADMDAFFAYSANAREVIVAAQQSTSYETKERIRMKLNELMTSSIKLQSFTKQWTVLDLGGEYAMLRIIKSNEGAYMGVWVDLNRFLSPFHTLELSDKGRVVIASSDGMILTHETDAEKGMLARKDLQEALSEQANAYNLVRVAGTKANVMIVNKQSQAADIHLVVILPIKSLLQQLPLFQWFIYIMPAIVTIILILFLLYLQRSITLPVHRLLKGMRNIREGNFMTRLEPSRLREFHDIDQTFNTMSDEIENLKIGIYEEKLKTHRAELKHLQAQIHPHFFTNCLNLIYNLAQVRNITLVHRLILLLVQHLRFTIRTNITSVSVKEELNHIQNYLDIQKVRFPESFEYEIVRNPNLCQYAIPPLTIQPFIENAMEHGFIYKDDGPFKIQISMDIERQEHASIDYLVIQVSDNGMGFHSDILTKLQSGEYFEHEFDDHIGIWNVHHRCKLFFRSETLIEFDNNSSGGAIVTLKLPLEYEHQERRDSHVSSTNR